MNTASEPLVSIVTPVYNEAEFLPECIESVFAQTYQNWDYTIVDNCSTDGSADIARRYAAKDRRIRIWTNREFLRAIPNHNVALRQISPTAEYCKVVLGDDWMFPECLERMVSVAEEHTSVGIVGAYALEGGNVAWTGLPYPSTLVSGREACRRHLLDRQYVFGSATSVLYRANLVRSHDPFYNEANIHADTEVCFDLLRSCDFGFVHQVLTYTRVRPGSLSTISSNIHSYFAGMLHTLVKYGPDYLSREELQTCVDQHLSAYYRFLGKSLMFSRDRTFWGFHKRKLTEAGVGFSRTRLVSGTLAALCGAALNPKDTIEKLWKSRKRC
jgi:glycosyltransferase involved in cell wall biosynthesis